MNRHGTDLRLRVRAVLVERLAIAYRDSKQGCSSGFFFQVRYPEEASSCEDIIS